MSQVFEKLKTKGLLKPLDPRLVSNPLPAKFDVSKRCAYHQGTGHDTDMCYNLCHAIQDLIDTKVIAPPTRPNITNNPLPNHNFGRGPRINYLIFEEEGEEDLSELIYDLPECFMMTWEELMGMTSTTGYNIWSEDTTEILNYLTSTHGGRLFKPQSDNPTSIYGERHFMMEKHMFVSHTKHTQRRINESISFAIDNMYIMKISEYKNKRVYLGAVKFKTKY